MEGYYSKRATANILGVTERQVNNYLKENLLKGIYQGRRLWIPKDEVERLHTRVTWGRAPQEAELQETRARVQVLENEMEVLKLGLGFGSRAGARDLAQLMLLRRKFMDLLTDSKWTNRQISAIADDLISIQERELINLIDHVGPTAWVPLLQLVDRMRFFIETRKTYPSDGLEVLHTRLTRSRDRFLGLVQVTSKLERQKVETATLMGLINKLGPLDEAILKYIDSLK
jgi:hypothetical protein